MMTRRVVVTGMGAVTTLGHGRQGLWEGVQRGESTVRSLTRFDPSPYRARMAAEVELNVADYLDRSSSNVSTVSHSLPSSLPVWQWRMRA